MAQVRCFAYSGSVPIRPANNNQVYVTHTAFTFKERYLARENLTVSTGGPVASVAATLAPESASQSILRVQCDPGCRVHYELTPEGYTLQDADTSSPTISGNDVLEWGRGWRISLLQATDPA